MFGCFALIGGLWGKALSLQLFNADIYASLASKQQITQQVLRGERGRIFFKDSVNNTRIPAAINNTKYDVILNPKYIQEELDDNKRQKTVKTLARVFNGVSEADITRILENQDDHWALIKREIDRDKVEKVQNTKIEGVYYKSQPNRIYPEGNLASHILGFVRTGEDNRRFGQYGVEQAFQNVLAGQKGFERKRTDTNGIWLASRKRTLKKPENGDDIVLSIDQTVQYQLEKQLQKMYDKYEPKRAFGAIMNPQTGEIYAMSKRPTFNPNTYSEIEKTSVYRNPFVSFTFEPGSIFKPLTMATGLDTGEITPQTTYVDKGTIEVDNRTIHNVWDEPQGTQTMTNVLEKSLNTGVVFVEQKVGHTRFRKYLRSFGLSEKTGISLPGEVTGHMRNIAKDDHEPRDINFATASFGQGITTTPIRMLSMFSAIVNEGKMVRPRIVDKIISEEGKVTETSVKESEHVFSEETARQLSEMLVSGVDNGFGEEAAVEGYRIGGKTGTSQKPLAKEAGYGKKTIHSFIEFATLKNPQYIMLLSLDNPNAKYSNRTVVPPAGELNAFLVNHFNLEPDRPSKEESKKDTSDNENS